MFGRKLALAAVLAAAGIAGAIACGPDFPWQLLDDRNQTLKATPENSFAFEAAHLVPKPADQLKAAELDQWATAPDESAALTAAEDQGLTHDQASTIENMRIAGSGDQAFAMGDGLPADVRLYTAGAVAFHADKNPEAAARFEAVLALPAAQRRLRGVWAAFMLGRIAALQGDMTKAAQDFQLARYLAAHGGADPLGLAVGSFGAEGKIHFENAVGALVGTPPPAPADGTTDVSAADETGPGFTLPTASVDTYRRELHAAAVLYAEQAARGSDSGVQSLRIIAENLVEAPERMAVGASDPFLERLLAVYVLSWTNDDVSQTQGFNNFAAQAKPDAGVGLKGAKVNPLVPSLIAAIEKSGVGHPAFADRLAALAYRSGRYDLAARMTALSNSPLSHWVQAKLALQKGDLAAAAAQYAAASRGFPATGSVSPENQILVQGENGTLALARGDYLDALDKLYPVAGTYPGDVAYIAERVLTTDELKTYVDEHVPAPQAAPPNTAPSPAATLRNLLARRLMRDGRYSDADDYFTDAKTRETADIYAAALEAGQSDWGRVDRANALFDAAKIARESGMEILGTEADPDYAFTEGAFSFGEGQTDPKGAYVTADERARFAASKPDPNLRFHYRYIAVDLVNKAADLLPPRSQAFAAVLCTASGWMMETEGGDARNKALYRRYVKEGPFVPWAKHFGAKCPAPDFAGAIYLERVTPLRVMRHFVSHHRWGVLAGTVLLLLLAVGGAFWWLRGRPRPVSG
jgi:hypothetical protein